MSRSLVPSIAQQEILMECLEEKRWLATGYARTTQARERTKAAWQEISRKLSSSGSGCIKTWQQWSKYWKDKKSAVKKKISQIRLARQRTGGGAEEEPLALSSIEERIVALLGGENYAIGDREHEINPFDNMQQDAGASDATTEASESILQPSTSAAQPLVLSLIGEQGSIGIEEIGAENISPPPPPSLAGNINVPPPEDNHGLSAPPPRGNRLERATTPPPASSAISSPRRRRLVGRRRALVGRSPPSQRRSHLASLVERFVAIEEQRVATEQMLAQNQQQLVAALKNISDAWVLQSQALQELVSKINNNN